MSSLFKKVLDNSSGSVQPSIHKIVLEESTFNKEVLSSSNEKKVLDTDSNILKSIKQPEPIIKCKLFKEKVFESIRCYYGVCR